MYTVMSSLYALLCSLVYLFSAVYCFWFWAGRKLRLAFWVIVLLGRSDISIYFGIVQYHNILIVIIPIKIIAIVDVKRCFAIHPNKSILVMSIVKS